MPRQANRLSCAASRKELPEARHLPGYVYYAPEIYDMEVETIFMKDWLCVGRVEQYEHPGDYRALRIAGEPVLVCRAEDGTLNAYANVCRHRGVEVASGRGSAKEFTCPYHAWVYDLKGRLVGAPFNKGVQSFDFGACRLPQIKLDTWEGYVFINFDPTSVSLVEYLAYEGTQRAKDVLRPGKTRLSDAYSFEVDCNWKFCVENFMDTYHVGVVHAASFAKHFPISEFRFCLSRDGRGDAEYESLTFAPEGKILLGPLPWLKDESDVFACYLVIPPNLSIFGRQDMIQAWLTEPLGPEKTRITIHTQLADESFRVPAAKERIGIQKDYIRIVASEDAAMLRSLQNGVKSRNFVPGPMVGLEKQIHHSINYYLDRMGTSLTSSI